MTAPEPGVRAASQELIEELMGAVVALDFVLQRLCDLPADAFPGEDRVKAIRELLVASASQEVEAVGEDACRRATALIEAVVNRIADDTDATTQLTELAARRPC